MAYIVLDIIDSTLQQDIYSQIDSNLCVKFTGDPNGVIAANIIGQPGFDTSGGIPWVATAADGTPGGTTWVRIPLSIGGEADASTSVKGILYLASSGDVSAGIDDTKAVTPLDLATYYAKTGSNSDITHLTGLTTPLSPSQGGSGLDNSSAANGKILIGNGSGFSLNTLTPGSAAMLITNSGGHITLDVNLAGLDLSTVSGAVDLASQVSGILPSTQGGTGLDSSGALAGAILIANGDGTFSDNQLTATSTKIAIANSAGGIGLDVNQGNLSLGSIGGSLALASQVSGTLQPNHGGTGQTVVPVDGQLLIGNSSTSLFTLGLLTATSSKIAVANGHGTIAIDVNQANLDLGSIGGSLNLSTQVTNHLAPINGGTGTATAPSAVGQILIATSSNVYTPATLTAGSSTISIGNASGAITLDVNQGNLSLGSIGGSLSVTKLNISGASDGNVPVYNSGSVSWGTAGGTGTVTSVGLSCFDGALLTISGSPVTGSGTIDININNQTPFTVYCAPSYSNFPNPGNFRNLTQRDLPDPTPQQISSANGIITSTPMPYSQRPGALTEYPTTDNPAGICCGPCDDFNIWFCKPSANSVSKMDLTGTVTDYSMGSSTPTAICVGPDGLLYATDNTGNILQIDPSSGSLLNTFAVPGTPTNMPSICTGINGLLWFTAPDAGYLYTMTTSGTFVGTNNMGGAVIPTYICFGHNDRMFFTNPIIGSGNGLIFQVDQYFDVQAWYLPSSGIPDRICSAHNRIWFTVPNLNKIGMLDPFNWNTTNTNLFSITGSNSNLGGICAAPDGKVAFVETDANQIGYINLLGKVVNETALTTGTAGGGNCCIGPDGAIYVAETSVAKIAAQAMDLVHR